ncbi:cysteine--1-D-myo-inosityl 2-amino-2-deoxy-alpha-D-glucopyranoside ligase [Nakamurella sp. A5-74]|uniref:L-cysteine:1D-myo-inositol 2-amino-2-deoxy-alpha-D-glucopyranoside ligase n=1 Tax=Nakamurella sp. A5-74 TaxID=3158264 RepID=A0AAU8DTM2_9ACTN
MHSWPTVEVPALSAVTQPLPQLRLHDSASDTVTPVSPPGPEEPASMYVCGITPYDATHIGHAATYVTFDLVNRYWRASGRTVTYVQNVTDVDDPLLERAERDGVDWRDLAREQTDLFRSDMTHLRVIPPERYVGVVEEMDAVSAGVARLLESGAAYRVPDDEYPDVYFDISTTGRFGYESRYDRGTMLTYSAERGGDPDRPGKRDPLDPLLWRCARPGEPSWESPLGAGRAGWHIECAVIAGKLLGERIDLQGGGSDLIFPHHECSAAHAEALTGAARFAGHYTHTGMLAYQGTKMSKSLGNLVFVSRLIASGVDPAAIRIALLSFHYRTDREWTDVMPAAATERLHRWREAARTTGQGTAGPTVDALVAALADDLDTPTAFRVLDDWAASPGDDSDAVVTAVDALLGIPLR